MADGIEIMSKLNSYIVRIFLNGEGCKDTTVAVGRFVAITQYFKNSLEDRSNRAKVKADSRVVSLR